MSDTGRERGLLSRLVDTGRTGNGEQGVIISERACAMLQVMALDAGAAELRKRLRTAFGKAMPARALRAVAADDVIVAATAPGEYWCLATGRDPEAFRAQVAEAVGDRGAVFQQSAARAVLTLRGRAAERLIGRACSLDLSPAAFPMPGAAHTAIEAMPVLVVKRDAAPTYDLAVAASYAESFLDWLLAAAQDHGYRIE